MSENYRPKSQPNVQSILHTLAYDCDVSSTSDEDVSSVTSQSSLLSWDLTEDYPVQPVSDSQIQIVRNYIPKQCSFVNKMKTFISSFDNVYTKEKSSQLKQQILDENVFPDFQQMWKFVGDLFVQNPDSAQISTTTSPTPEIVYKSIDFSKVNVRNMANIPKPTSCPVHGCSNDPKFYTEIVKLDSVDYYGRNYTAPCRHQATAPFGSQFGYKTNDGIVPVPDQCMVTCGLTISVTGSSTPSSPTTAPRLRGEERDPRLQGRHQPGEDGRPREQGERERGDATILPRQLGRCRVHIVACITFCLLCFYVISQIHTFNPKTCRSITTIIRLISLTQDHRNNIP